MNAPEARTATTLDDKYRIREGWIYLSGTQALVRLPLQQRLRDAAEGKRTGGYITGYRGSPLGRYDMELWREEALLREHGIHFRAAVNEDLAATALWGAQYVGQFPGARVDGVFGIWYGKGPGVDRSGDVFRHANGAGTGPLGGVLALAGDDHGAKSSTICNFSDQIFIATGMPVLYPSTTQELLDFGLHGIAMSRYSGCWVGMKVVMDVVEGGGSIYVAPDSPRIVVPAVAPAPTLGPAGWNIRRMDMPLPQEDRLYNHKLFAALDYIRANGLNRVSHAADDARLGILAAGKAYQDVLQAIAELGLDEVRLRELGVRIGKIGVIWPLDPVFVAEFAAGLDTLLVVEEKRSLIESQVKSILYDLPGEHRPRVLGRHDGAHEWSPDRGDILLPGTGEISPPLVARVLAGLLRHAHPDCKLAPVAMPARPAGPGPLRMPSFCSGCPHNRSTKVLEGSRALAGIGCHTIAMLQNPAQTMTVSHMGGEGAMWLGQQPFTEERHVFANMGDGTYFHSGFLAIRQAVAAKVPITYKLLVNGFVSMTGGQPIDGELGVPRMVGELMAEGVNEIIVVTDEPAKYAGAVLPHGVPVYPRDEMDAVQRRCREFPGVSVILYEQPCATERRRLRKRGKWPDPEVRAYIHPLLCEGCGDCGKVSNCLSVEPLETPFGRKRKINQSTCNKDFTCVEGFCPSFVTLEGARPRRSAAAVPPDLPPPPEPAIVRPQGAFSILVTGIGGTGVVTIGQVIGMAAHLDGLRCSVLDVTGLAQKYGAVLSHVRFAPEAGMLHATRIAAGEADTVIGCDLIVTAGDEAASRMRAGDTRVAVCSDVIPTAEFARNPDWQIDRAGLLARIAAASGQDPLAIEGIRIATALMGDAIAANMFMLGLAWQQGWVPLSRDAILRAIELNGVQVDFNRRCFELGRQAAQDPERVARLATPAAAVQLDTWRNESLPQQIARRADYLAEYRDAAYAERYRHRVAEVTEAENRLGLGTELAATVARNLFKLMAIKDEWEVARLFADESFRRELEQQFEGDFRIHFHLGAWPFGITGDAGKVGAGGTVQKRPVGPWLMRAFRLMAARRHWRDTWLDVFRHSDERRLARRLLADYEAEVERLVAGLDAGNHALAVKLAALPEKIRGYGHVRAAAAAGVDRERAELLVPPAVLVPSVARAA